MIFRKILLCVVTIFGVLLSFNASAVQLEVDRDMDLPTGGVFDSNSVNVEIMDNKGIYSYLKRNTDPFKVTTSGDISTSNNRETGVYSKYSRISIEGTPEGNFTLTSKNNSDGIYAEDTTDTGAQSDSAVYIKNMNVNASNNSQSGLFAANAGTISVYGSNSVDVPNKLTVNSNLYGIISEYTESFVDVYNMDIEAKDNALYGIVSLKGVSSIKISGVSGKNNRMDLEGNGEYALAVFNRDTIIEGLSKFQVYMMDIYVKNNNFAIIEDEATMEFKKSNIFIADDSRGLEVGASGVADLEDVNFYTDYNLFYTNEFGDSALKAKNSLLNGSIFTGVIVGNTSTITFTDTTWKMLHDSNMTTLNLIDSTADLRSKTAGTFNSLTLKNYTSTGVNKFYLNTVLGNDSSLTDKIIIDSGASSGTGNSVLFINNQGGMDDETVDGIKVVEAINGATTGANDFSLAGGVVDSTAYEYNLFKGDSTDTDTQSWFLRSSKKLSENAQTIANVPALMMEMAKTGMNSLSKRMGDIRTNNPKNKNGAWVRTYAKTTTVDDKISTDMKIFGLEGGYDMKLDINSPDSYYIGLMSGYLTSEDIKTKQNNGGGNGSGHGSAPSVGIYGTWLKNNGWFVDATLRNFWAKMDLTSHTSTGNAISYESERNILMGSLETGRKIYYAFDSRSNWTLEPKAKITAGHASSDKFRTSTGNSLYYDDTNSLALKFSVDAGYKRTLNNCTVIEPYLHFGAINEFREITDIRYNNANYKSDLRGFSLEYGAGLNAQLNQATSIYSDVMYEKGSVVESLSGNFGMRYTW